MEIFYLNLKFHQVVAQTWLSTKLKSTLPNLIARRYEWKEKIKINKNKR